MWSYTPDNKLIFDAKALYTTWKIYPSYEAWKKACKRKNIKVYGHGNSEGQKVVWESVPQVLRDQIMTIIKCSPYEIAKYNIIESHITEDIEAARFYSNFITPLGNVLPLKAQKEYTCGACILNAIRSVDTYSTQKRRTMIANCNPERWAMYAARVNDLDRHQWPHGLPGSANRLRIKYNEYLADGYVALISGKYGMQNSRKINPQLQKLIVSLACMPNRPMVSHIMQYYQEFLEGEYEIFDTETGELFEPENYMRNGEPIEISETSVHNILKANKRVIDKLQQSKSKYNLNFMPHAHRHRSDFVTMVKISMDDFELASKTDSGITISGYLVYEPVSQAIIVTVYSAKKDITLIWDCFRLLMETCEKEEMVWPGEVEVEHHLMKSIETELNDMFYYVRFCNPGNSKEKLAEDGIRLKKYGTMKKWQNNVGRHYGKTAVFNVNEDIKEKKSIESVIATDMEVTAEHNATLHPKQDLYPGLTRWQVLKKYQSQKCDPPRRERLMRHLGNRTATSIVRNDYVQVQREKFAIDHACLTKLKPGNFGVMAYWLPDANGKINEVYLWQDDNYLCKAILYPTFVDARMEETETDKENKLWQQKRFAHYIKEDKELAAQVPKVKVQKKTNVLVAEGKALDVSPYVKRIAKAEMTENIDFDIDTAQRAFDDI